MKSNKSSNEQKVFYTGGPNTAKKPAKEGRSLIHTAHKDLPTREELVAYITNEINSVVAEYDLHRPNGERSSDSVYDVFKTRAYLIERFLLAIASEEQEKNIPDEELLLKSVNGIQTMERLLSMISCDSKKSNNENNNENHNKNHNNNENQPGYAYIPNDLTRELLNPLQGEFIDTYYPFLRESERQLNNTTNYEDDQSNNFSFLDGIELTQQDLDWYKMFQEKINLLTLSDTNKKKSDLTDSDCKIIRSLLEEFLTKLVDDRIDTQGLISYKTLSIIHASASTIQADKAYNINFIKLKYSIIKGAMYNILQVIKDGFVK